MVRTSLLVSLLVALSTGSTSAEPSLYGRCPFQDGNLEAKVDWVKKVGCTDAMAAIHTCSDGARTAIALTNAAVDVCRGDLAKGADAVKEHDALAKRCEAKLANHTKHSLDNELDVATCRLLAAQLLVLLDSK